MKKIYIFMVILLTGSVVDNFKFSLGQNETATLLDYSVDGLFGRHSMDGKTIKSTEFFKFAHDFGRIIATELPRPANRFDTDSDHDSDHGRDHDHDHAHDHDHSHDDLRATAAKLNHTIKFDCLKKVLDEIRRAHAVPDSLDKQQFIQATTLVVAGLDSCYNNVTQIPTEKTTTAANVNNRRDNWIFAFLSAFIITVLGLLCYLIVPLLSTYCFNKLFQFLVALAVGSLSGDSLLHLIPHAFMGGHSHDSHGASGSHDHTIGVYKGLGAVVGIYVFYLIEKIMQMRRALKEKRHRESELQEADIQKFLYDKEDLLKNETTLKVNGDLHAHVDDSKPNEITLHSNFNNLHDNTKTQFNYDDDICLVIHANKDLKYISQYLPNNKCDENIDHHDHENEKEHLHKHSRKLGKLDLSHSEPNLRTETEKEVRTIKSKEVENTPKQNDIITNTPANNATQCLCSTSLIPSTDSNSTRAQLMPDKDVHVAIKDNRKKRTGMRFFFNFGRGGRNQDQDSAKSHSEKENDKFSSRTTESLLHKNKNVQHSHHYHDHDHDHQHHHHHHHHHGHSHSHIYKSQREKAHHDHHMKHEKEINDIKLIAWMVIMGDGLHNFSDGLAIGASFASSLTTGFGTAIAVLCHELPHEIGDFAVLRRAGVSLKRALVFNAVSGVMCMFGVLIGLYIGGFEMLTSWAFLFIAGTFLYISLVDMIPELSENKEDVSILNFFIQSSGILTGIGIMLAIALFEEKIVLLFS